VNRSLVKVTTLGAMCFPLFMANLDNTVVSLVLPKIQTSLGSNFSGLQWVLNAYTLAAASLVLISATLGNIYGRKRVFLTGLVIFMMASVVCGLSPSGGILIAGRTLQGIGAAALIPTSLFILADTFPKPKEKAKALVIWSLVSVIALVAGPGFGKLLLDTLGWQSLFFLNVPLSAIAFWVTARVVKEAINSTKQRLNLSVLALSIVLLATLTYALTQGNNGLWQSPLILWLLVDGLSLMAFLSVEYSSSRPMLSLRLFSNQRFGVFNFVSVLAFFTVVSLPLSFNVFLQQAQGYSTTGNYQNLNPLQPKELAPKLTSQEKTQLLADSTTSQAQEQSSSVPALLLTPASDLGSPTDAKIQTILGRAGNDTLYGYDPIIDSQKTQKIDVLLGDLFDNNIEEYTIALQIQAGNPAAILGHNPPTVGIDRFIVGDANQPYYTDSSGNSNNLLTTNFLGLNEFAVIYDFNSTTTNQDIIRLNGTKSDYALVDANGVKIAGYDQAFNGKAIFSLQQGLPDLVAYVIENPDVKLDLNANYFEFVGAKPKTKPTSKKIDELSTTGFDFSTDAASDPSDNFYLTGSTSGSLEGPVIGSNDAWVAKYDSNGNKLWGKQIGTPNSDAAQSVATDKNGNFYLTGTTSGNLFSSLNSTSNDGWVAKFDSNGNQLWGKQFGSNVTGGFSTNPFGLKVDQAGNVYVSGLAIKTNTRQDIYPFVAQDDSFVIKFDSNGNQQWYTEIRDPNAPFPFNLAPFFDENYDLALDKNGNSYLVGWTQGLEKESNPGSNFLKYDVWISKVDTSGKLQWIRQFGSVNQGVEFGWNIATDSQGNVYPMGWTTGDLGTPDSKKLASYDGYLAKFGPDGTQQWIKQFGSQGDDGTYNSGMTIDSQDNIFIMGYTNNKFGKGSSNPAYNAWLAKFDTSGNNQWVQQFGTKNRLTYPAGVTVNKANTVTVTGFTDGPLGTSTTGSEGAVDAWFAQFDAKNGNLKNFTGGGGSKNVDSTNNPGAISVADASNNLVTSDKLPDGDGVINPAAGTNVNVGGVINYGQIFSNLGKVFDSNADNSFPKALAQAVNNGTIVVANAQKQKCKNTEYDLK